MPDQLRIVLKIDNTLARAAAAQSIRDLKDVEKQAVATARAMATVFRGGPPPAGGAAPRVTPGGGPVPGAAGATVTVAGAPRVQAQSQLAQAAVAAAALRDRWTRQDVQAARSSGSDLVTQAVVTQTLIGAAAAKGSAGRVDAARKEAAAVTAEYRKAANDRARLAGQAAAAEVKAARDAAAQIRAAQGGLTFTPAPGAGMRTVRADLAKLHASLAKDAGYYVTPGGGGAAKPGAYPNVVSFLEKAAASGAAVHQPRVVLRHGEAVVDDGRHRLARLMEMGVRVVPVSVPRRQAASFARKFGADELPALEGGYPGAGSGAASIARAREIAQAHGIATRVMTRAQAESMYAHMAPGAVGRVPASYFVKDRRIDLNPFGPGWDDPGYIQRMHAEGRWSSAHPDHAIHHEIGHARHFANIDEARRKAQRVTGFDERSSDYIRRHVGGYAAKSQTEFVAEMYAGMAAGKTFNPTLMRNYHKLGGVLPAGYRDEIDAIEGSVGRIHSVTNALALQNKKRRREAGEQAGVPKEEWEKEWRAKAAREIRLNRGVERGISHRGVLFPGELSHQGQDALEHYAGFGFRNINDVARGRWKPKGEEAAEIKARTAALDEVIRSGRLARNVSVYRGTRMEAFGRSELPIPGQVLRDRGFLSTSTDRDLAEGFNHASILMHIRARKGINAADITHHRGGPENEILFGRDQPLRVLSVREGKGGRHEIMADMIDPARKAEADRLRAARAAERRAASLRESEVDTIEGGRSRGTPDRIAGAARLKAERARAAGERVMGVIRPLPEMEMWPGAGIGGGEISTGHFYSGHRTTAEHDKAIRAAYARMSGLGKGTADRYTRTERVRIRDLLAGQEGLDKEHLERLSDPRYLGDKVRAGNYPTVAEVGGIRSIEDGHHRLAVMQARGQTHATVHLFRPPDHEVNAIEGGIGRGPGARGTQERLAAASAVRAARAAAAGDYRVPVTARQAAAKGCCCDCGHEAAGRGGKAAGPKDPTLDYNLREPHVDFGLHKLQIDSLKLSEKRARQAEKAAQKEVDLARKMAAERQAIYDKANTDEHNRDLKAARDREKLAERELARAQRQVEQKAKARERAEAGHAARGAEFRRRELSEEQVHANALNRVTDVNNKKRIEARAKELGTKRLSFAEAIHSALGLESALTKVALAGAALTALKYVVTGIANAMNEAAKNTSEFAKNALGTQKDLRQVAAVEGRRNDRDFMLEVAGFGRRTGLGVQGAARFRESFGGRANIVKGVNISDTEFEKYREQVGRIASIKGIPEDQAGDLFGNILKMEDFTRKDRRTGKVKGAEAATARALGTLEILDAGAGLMAKLIPQFNELTSQLQSEAELEGVIRTPGQAAVVTSVLAEAGEGDIATKVRRMSEGLRDFTKEKKKPFFKRAGLKETDDLLTTLGKVINALEEDVKSGVPIDVAIKAAGFDKEKISVQALTTVFKAREKVLKPQLARLAAAEGPGGIEAARAKIEEQGKTEVQQAAEAKAAQEEAELYVGDRTAAENARARAKAALTREGRATGYGAQVARFFKGAAVFGYQSGEYQETEARALKDETARVLRHPMLTPAMRREVETVRPGASADLRNNQEYFSVLERITKQLEDLERKAGKNAPAAIPGPQARNDTLPSVFGDDEVRPRFTGATGLAARSGGFGVTGLRGMLAASAMGAVGKPGDEIARDMAPGFLSVPVTDPIERDMEDDEVVTRDATGHRVIPPDETGYGPGGESLPLSMRLLPQKPKGPGWVSSKEDALRRKGLGAPDATMIPGRPSRFLNADLGASGIQRPEDDIGLSYDAEWESMTADAVPAAGPAPEPDALLERVKNARETLAEENAGLGMPEFRGTEKQAAKILASRRARPAAEARESRRVLARETGNIELPTDPAERERIANLGRRGGAGGDASDPKVVALLERLVRSNEDMARRDAAPRGAGTPRAVPLDGPADRASRP